jgi:peptidoglycan/LPS O-acetylase OafA/YrhL
VAGRGGARAGRLSAWFEAPWLRAAGRYSYGVYVYHHLLRSLFERMVPLRRLAAALHSDLAALAVFVTVATVVSLALAVASYHLLEARLLALKRFFPARRPASAAALGEADRCPGV